MASELKPLSEKQWLVTVEGVEGTWRKATAPKVTREKIRYTDPTLGRTRKHLGFAENDEITLTKDYDAETDGATVDWILKKRVGKETVTPFTITFTPVYADVAGSKYEGSASYTLTGCLLSDWQLMGPDRGGSGLSTLEIVVTWDDVQKS